MRWAFVVNHNFPIPGVRAKSPKWRSVNKKLCHACKQKFSFAGDRKTDESKLLAKADLVLLG